ncbi:MAG: metallophosphoesterase family protein [Bryobacteraceae bacterium]|nr:metallophosphoesterase family protein [Bryobacteraceae bacterium]
MKTIRFPSLSLSRRAVLAVAVPAVAVVLAALEISSAPFAPSPLPDRIVANWTASPATSFSVTWRTDASVAQGFAEIAEASDGPSFEKNARRVAARKEAYTAGGRAAHAFSVTFEGLRTSTEYLYRVGDGGESWSEWIPFRTAADREEPFTFLYLGDAQTRIHAAWARVVRKAYETAPDARFLIHAGDLINNHDRDEQWGEWHAASSWVQRVIPSMPVPGNHEYGRGPDGQRRLTVNWRAQFTLPANGPEGLEETCYFVDFQGVRLVGLNSNEKLREQAAWLDRLLAKNPNRWTIVFFHHPLYSGARGRDNREVRELWQPVFDRHGVDLVLSGHDHIYTRTRLVRGDGAREGGTVYVISVSGAKMYEPDERPQFPKVIAGTQMFQVIRVRGDELSFEARTARGTLADSFVIEKRGGAKRLIEK